MGEKNAADKPEDNDFRDRRNAAARDMDRAKNETKHDMLRRMIAAALEQVTRPRMCLETLGSDVRKTSPVRWNAARKQSFR